MARFLSLEWFADIAIHGTGPAPEVLDEGSLVIEQVVEGTPRALLDGRVRVRGNLAKLASADPRERAGDPVPERVRANTSY